MQYVILHIGACGRRGRRHRSASVVATSDIAVGNIPGRLLEAVAWHLRLVPVPHIHQLTIDIEPLVLLFGRAFAFAPLHKFVSPFVAGIVRVSFDVDKRDRSMTPPTLYVSEQSAIHNFSAMLLAIHIYINKKNM